MGLCSLCQSISTKALVFGNNTIFHHTSETLKQSVSEKCYICSQVWNSMNEEQKGVARRPDFDGIDYEVSLGKTNYHGWENPVLAKVTFEHGEDLWDCEEYDKVGGTWMDSAGQYAILNPNVFPVEHIPVLADRTNHPSCWATVSRWIEDCSKHDNCNKPQQESWLPTRLVDLLRYDKGRVRVVNSSRLSRRLGISYLALSHCWGEKPFLVMRKKNKKKLKKGMSISSLPPNFRDAIAVAHQLGFRYMWIDSLCIIQGSTEDWRREAPTMNQVYRNAFLTIGAMASPDAHGGLFRYRDPEMMGPYPITINSEEEGVMKCLLVKSDIWESHVKQAPLSQRAWVVQERILAPRSLYFCEDQLFWECREQHACESLPEGMSLEFLSDTVEKMAVDAVPIKAFERAVELAIAHDTYANRMADDSIPWEIVQYEDPYMVWNNILESYARCALTNPSDKFVAISGLAKDFARLIDDEYLAGLWRKNFINGLLWTTNSRDRDGGDYVPAVRPKVYRAPSWSWASLDAPSMKTPNTEFSWYGEYAEIQDVVIELASDDPTGGLTHACLHASGHLIELKRKPVYHGRYLGRFGLFIPDTEEFQGKRFFCWPLREDVVNKTPDLKGLVLTPCLGEEEGEMPSCSKCAGQIRLRRVGVFESDQGEPLRYLTMCKPHDWVDWGEEKDHLWFPEDAEVYDFIII